MNYKNVSRNKYEKNQQKWSKRANKVCDSEFARWSIQVFILNWNSLQTRFTYFVWNQNLPDGFYSPSSSSSSSVFSLLCFIPFRFPTRIHWREQKKNRWIVFAAYWNCDEEKNRIEKKKNETSTKRKASVCVCCASVIVWNETIEPRVRMCECKSIGIFLVVGNSTVR